MKLLTPFLVLLLLGPPAESDAQDTTEVIRIHSLEEAWSYALTNNTDYATYQLQEAKAENQFKMARSQMLPQVNASFNGQNNQMLATTPIPGEIFGQPGTTIYTQFGKNYAYNTGLSASMPLLDWQLMLQTKMARVGHELATAEKEYFEQTLREQVALCYYTALITKQALAESETEQNLTDSILALSSSKMNQGLIDKLTLNLAKINANLARQSVAGNEILLADAIFQLKLLLALSPATQLELMENVASNSGLQQADEILLLGLGADKALNASARQLHHADLNVNYYKMANMPRITVSQYVGAQQYRDDFGMSFNNDSWKGNSYTSVNLTIPLFTSFSNKNKLKIAKIERDMDFQQYLQTQEQSLMTDTLLIEKYRYSVTQTHLSEENKLLYAQNMQLTLQRFQDGLSGMDAYLQAFEDYLQAESAYLNALSNTYGYCATILSRQ